MLPWDIVGDRAGMARVCSSGAGQLGWPGLLHVANGTSDNALGCQPTLLQLLGCAWDASCSCPLTVWGGRSEKVRWCSTTRDPQPWCCLSLML